MKKCNGKMLLRPWIYKEKKKKKKVFSVLEHGMINKKKMPTKFLISQKLTMNEQFNSLLFF